jgi:hypothetical protein
MRHLKGRDRVVRRLNAVDKLNVTIAEIHVDEVLLDDYVLRRCDAYAGAAGAQHLAECSGCLAKWVELVELRAALTVNVLNGSTTVVSIALCKHP